jgi:hypothetical protein
MSLQKKYCTGKSIIFAVNLQVPAGPRHFSLVLYYEIEAELMEVKPNLNEIIHQRTMCVGNYDEKLCIL